MEELKLYCPATGELTGTSEYEWDDEVTDDTYQLDGQELTSFSALIQEALKKEMDFPEATDRGLMEYYGWDNSVNEKVRSMTVTVEEVGGRLYGVGVCQVDGKLNREELSDLKDENMALEYELNRQKDLMARLMQRVEAALTFLEEKLPEQFRPYVQRARAHIMPEPKQEHRHDRGMSMGGMSR